MWREGPPYNLWDFGYIFDNGMAHVLHRSKIADVPAPKVPAHGETSQEAEAGRRQCYSIKLFLPRDGILMGVHSFPVFAAMAVASVSY